MPANDAHLLLRAFCDELARCGVEHACTSPGSRCAPIVLSLVREPRIRCWSHLDERCAGFFALGVAKASGRPAVVACTSGTAAANLAPAVIEAFQARVPLIVLTADRPPELREVGAGQTIDQLKLYGSAARWFFELDLGAATADRLRWIRTMACRAYWTAYGPVAGPVHLNVPLRDPLVPEGTLPHDSSGREGGRPYVVWESPPPAALSGSEHPSGEVVIVAGAGSAASADPQRLALFARDAEIPLLADPLSGARRGEAAIAHYDLLLRDAGFAHAHRPRFVLRVGDLPTSKPLRAWLAGLDAAQIAIDPDDAWHDPSSVVGLRISAPYSSLLDASPALPMTAPGWLSSWREADRAAGRAIAGLLGEGLSEPLVAARLGEWLSPEATLFVASSMPIRDVESFFPALSNPPRVLANRGANGIDGTVSCGFGVAAASDGPSILLIGDVALAHDIGGLLAALRLELAVTIVLLNNDGGGIFHFLPVSGEADVFEEHVATPHRLDFSQLAEVYGCRYARPVDWRELRDAVAGGAEAAETTIVEVRTDRPSNLALHRAVERSVHEALKRPVGR